MIEEFMKMLKNREREQGGPRKDAKMQAKSSMAKELSDMLGGDITEGIKEGMKGKDVVKAGFTSSKEDAPEAAKKLEEVVSSKFSEDESDESEEKEDESEMMKEDESEESYSSDDLESEISKLEDELKNKRKKLESMRS
jgi:TATA-binding protein-associated factor Taf7